jgi:hypothetical protein
MRIREIDFSKTLLDAQRAGDLVVIAGAGVSIPVPSNYPNFDKLADEVASGVLVRDGVSCAAPPPLLTAYVL